MHFKELLIELTVIQCSFPIFPIYLYISPYCAARSSLEVNLIDEMSSYHCSIIVPTEKGLDILTFTKRTTNVFQMFYSYLNAQFSSKGSCKRFCYCILKQDFHSNHSTNMIFKNQSFLQTFFLFQLIYFCIILSINIP